MVSSISAKLHTEVTFASRDDRLKMNNEDNNVELDFGATTY